MLSNLLMGLSALANIESVLLMLVGTLAGIVVGGIPGLNGSMAIALLIPITYTMEPVTAISMLCGIYNGAMYGGSISAILFGIPGTPAACATVIDGHPMAKKGQAMRALELSASGSCFGGMLSAALLIVAAPTLAKFALKFGPAEYFWVSMFGLSIIVSLSNDSMVKGLIAGFFGLFLAVIGQDPNTAVSRFVLKAIPKIGSLKVSTQLLSGLELVPVLVGLFALPEVFYMLEHAGEAKKKKTEANIDFNENVHLFDQFPKRWVNYVRSAIIGTVVGIIPAAGGNIASFISYDMAKRASKDPGSFGKGNPDAVLASETANNGVTGGSFVPLLSLGVPGSTSTAVIMGAFMIQGITLGPSIFNTNADVVYALMLALILTNIPMVIMGFYGSKIFSKSLNIPQNVLAPIILAFSVVGSYAIRYNMFDVIVLFVFGLFGYLMNKVKFPMAPLVLGLILGPILESNLLRALAMSRGKITGLVNSPISLAIFIMVLVCLITGARNTIQSRSTFTVGSNIVNAVKGQDKEQ
ncbi:tripartite tricarboxylate transporter permease [Yanshouia hominis]|uniref:Tripartite tricarboxylate transporter permease n=1 Tax=Yanshouia hominis TaxID=2763673 RepID=A0ABR7NM20_9FIRM|nr:tripartite tricarboxylate transporter permease [Yanshouia hominis]MBC8577459.1 tripartite tricarboxylate transporter permease [Yanshouia hominis]